MRLFFSKGVLDATVWEVGCPDSPPEIAHSHPTPISLVSCHSLTGRILDVNSFPSEAAIVMFRFGDFQPKRLICYCCPEATPTGRIITYGRYFQ